MNTPILQFGTSRFLQAHADLFVSEALDHGHAIGPITVVQTSGDPGRATRVGALAAQNGFPVIVRGMEGTTPVEREVRVRSVRRALSTATDWQEVRRVFVEEAEVVLSNTGDRGYALADQDGLEGVPRSFPMKLLALLQARYQGGGRALTILPCELISRNGEVLQALIMRLAAEHGPDAGFQTWLSSDVVWANSLVDRIVSEPIEPAGAIAEPYALWAIEQQPCLVVPCTHPAIRVVPDLTPYEKLKLHILNLGHTLLAERWLKDGRHVEETVREILEDGAISAYLSGIYESEVIPGFESHGLGDEAQAYVETTLARFRNPYLKHRLSDIAGNHAEKIQRRFVGFMDWCPGIATPELKRIATG
ncbi:mannitol dehydrogenase family protein [Rhizobium glycinendophyticum]|uniref:Mannitol dehydrogenase family protein n=1 Tax=Rhizobium glycinendophyticum TaxID=2589807 RepID=A0A504UQ10_9HYPH|nr:mannitol dehydrogenase family protein [Rhizobium glycinendophyticum]TPP07163.1 mannitol dehydrogenase family protein [Rhizobium glycinendophyticum]